MFDKLKGQNKYVKEFLDFDLAVLFTVSIFVNNLGSLIANYPNMGIKPLDISFLLLDKLNETNYFVEGNQKVKLKLQELYDLLLKNLVTNKAITIEEILKFYQTALLPKSNSAQTSNATGSTTYEFKKPLLDETQDFINFTFQNLLRIIDVTQLSPKEIISFSGLVYPFIFKTASSTVKSNREHGIPMLLFLTKKMAKYDEEGVALSKTIVTSAELKSGLEKVQADSLVQNYSAQLNSIIRYNL